MTEHSPEKELDPPAPEVKKKSGLSLVWLIPILTAIIGGWLIIKTLSEMGPRITITFKTAEGIEVGKTKIKYKEIEIGVVDSVRFSEDFSRVILKASMVKEAKSFLRRDTRFWVVKPRLSLRGASGLSTLVSGAYIEIEPGQGALQKHFIGLDIAPVVKADEAGRKVILMAKRLGSIDTGSPIYYQGIMAGEVLGYELGNDKKSVFIHGFIRAPYDGLVQSNTRFWNVSGMDFSIAAEGVKVRTESIQSLLFGGISFDTPDTIERAKEDLEGLIFTLYENFESIQEDAFTEKIKFILYFEDSVRGLHPGAPVEFKGIRIGSVVDIRLEFDKSDTSFRIPVIIEIEPQRVVERGQVEVSSPYQTLETLVKQGLRAQLQTGSLLTGQLLVALNMHPETDIRMAKEAGTYPELPTIPASLEQITTSFKKLLAKLEKVDLDKIAVELLGTLEGINKLTNELQVEDAVTQLKESFESFQSVLRKVDDRVEPLTDNIEKAIGAGQETMEKAQATMSLLNKVLTPDSPLQFKFNQMTEELAETARSIRALVDLLERNPKSFIFGKNPPGDDK